DACPRAGVGEIARRGRKLARRTRRDARIGDQSAVLVVREEVAGAVLRGGRFHAGPGARIGEVARRGGSGAGRTFGDAGVRLEAAVVVGEEVARAFAARAGGDGEAHDEGGDQSFHGLGRV